MPSSLLRATSAYGPRRRASGGSPPPSRARAWICPARVKPSIPGICESMSTRGKGSPGSLRLLQARAGPHRRRRRGWAASPQSSRSSPRIARFVALSSATSTRRPFIRASGARPAGAALAARAEAGREVEGAAAARLALDPDPAAHHADQLRRDRQAEPGAAEAARRRAVGLGERGEDQRPAGRGGCRSPCRSRGNAGRCPSVRRSALVIALTRRRRRSRRAR